jgi:hypothetical protein
MAKDSHANSIASIQLKLRPKTFEVGAGVFLDPVEMSDQTQDSRNAAVPAPPSKVHLLTWLCAEVRDERVDDPAQEELHDPAILFWPRHFPSSRRPDVNLEKNQHLRRAVSFAVARPEKSRSKYVKVRLVWIGERTVAEPRRRIRCRFTWTATTR